MAKYTTETTAEQDTALASVASADGITAKELFDGRIASILEEYVNQSKQLKANALSTAYQDGDASKKAAFDALL